MTFHPEGKFEDDVFGGRNFGRTLKFSYFSEKPTIFSVRKEPSVLDHFALNIILL